jgi:hypothetical protein
MTIKVAILGASSSAGLGVNGRSYAVRCAERLGAEVLQFSRTAQTVLEVTPQMLAEVREFAPDLVILSFGAAEAYVHPSRFLQAVLDRFAPRSWRGVAGMEPRPYFSRSRGRRARQRLVSRVKVLLKRRIIRVTGGYHRVPSEVFAERLREILDGLGPAGKVLTGLWQVDAYMFPRSNPVLRRNDDLLREIAAERADTSYVASVEVVRCWEDFLADHAHLNDRGHEKVADLILRTSPAEAAR